MSTQTTNLGLTKPSGNEKPFVSVLNTDLDIIDEAVGDVDVQADGSLQDQIDALGESVTRWQATTDSGGRVFINKPIEKIRSVCVFSTTYWAHARYLNDAQTLIYIKDTITNDAVPNVSVDVQVTSVK